MYVLPVYRYQVWGIQVCFVTQPNILLVLNEITQRWASTLYIPPLWFSTHSSFSPEYYRYGRTTGSTTERNSVYTVVRSTGTGYRYCRYRGKKVFLCVRCTCSTQPSLTLVILQVQYMYRVLVYSGSQEVPGVIFFILLLVL